MEITLGNLYDQLSICNIRIWMLEDKCRDKDATDKQIADAKRKINTCNQQRNDLIQAIDERSNERNYGQGSNKIYGK